MEKTDIFHLAHKTGRILLHGGAFKLDNQVFLLVAPSGWGKSTLLAALSLLEIPVSDEYILVDIIENEAIFEIFGMAISLTLQSQNLFSEMPLQMSVTDKQCHSKKLCKPQQQLIYQGTVSGILFIDNPHLQEASSCTVPAEHRLPPARINRILEQLNSAQTGVLLLKSLVRHLNSSKDEHIQSRRKCWNCLNTILDTVPACKIIIDKDIPPCKYASRLVKALESFIDS